MSGRVLWITGLSGSGKSTLARGVIDLMKKSGINPIFLDGDDLRMLLNHTVDAKNNYSKDFRLEMSKTYSRFCRHMANQGHIVVIATISLFDEIHEWNRSHLPGYFEVYLDVPIIELRKRDSKGIYSNFDKGITSQVMGLDMTIEEPKNPDLTIRFQSIKSFETLCAQVLEKFLNTKSLST